MAAASGRDRAPVSEQLLDEAYRFDFFQAVRLLERWPREAAEPQAAAAAASRVGQRPPRRSRRSVRFRALPSLSFPAGASARSAPRRNRPPTSAAAAAGDGRHLPGADRAERRPAPALHRAGDRADPRRRTTRCATSSTCSTTACLAVLSGLGEVPLSARLRAVAARARPARRTCYAVPVLPGRPWARAGLRGRLDVRRRGAALLRRPLRPLPPLGRGAGAVVADYFELPVDVRQFQGQWLYLSRGGPGSLPVARLAARAEQRAGRRLVVGERVWDVQSKFRVRLGPLGYAQFRRLHARRATPCGRSAR